MTATTLTAQFAAVLSMFDELAGVVTIDARTIDGIGHAQQRLMPPFTAGVPLHLLGLLRDGLSLRIAPATADPFALPFAFVMWRMKTDFDAQRGRHQVLPDSQASVAAAIATMPAPSVVVDGGHEVWTGWRLQRPISDVDEATQLLTRLAWQLGGDLEAAERAFTVPVAGPVRNWGNREFIHIDHVDGTQRYAFADLLREAPGGQRVEGHSGRTRRARASVGA